MRSARNTTAQRTLDNLLQQQGEPGCSAFYDPHSGSSELQQKHVLPTFVFCMIKGIRLELESRI